MMLPSVIAFGAHLLIPVADQVPVFNIEQVCIGIARQSAASPNDPSIPKQRTDCINSEKDVRVQLVQQWAKFSAADRNSCVNEARMGGDSSYTELLTCLEMARDVRNLHNENTAVPSVSRPRR